MAIDDSQLGLEEMSLAALRQVVRAQEYRLAHQESLLACRGASDSLTGLATFEILERRTQQAIDNSARTAIPFALLLLNVNRFRFINDAFGHFAGDEYLREIGTRLREIVKAEDLVARIGADEFAILLTSIGNQAEAFAIANLVMESLRPEIILLGTNLKCSCSMGLAFFPSDARSVTNLFHSAGSAMAIAKQQRRNAIYSYSATTEGPTPTTIKLETELRHAIHHGELALHYQPQVAIGNSSVHSAEALVRWKHPERGMIPPLEFIGLAEECGLIHELGDWVIHEACRQSRAWSDDGLAPIRLAVNLSAAQFRHGGLAATIKGALDATQVHPSYFEVELTETTVMKDAQASADILSELSAMGVIVSVDDFGTGYSSLSYLRKFPVDKLKIDRSFVKASVDHPDDASIVRAIVSLAHSLRMQVVAEGVETRQQLDFLTGLGCDKYQGFYFSPAVPPADFAQIIRRQMDAQVNFMQNSAMRTHSKLAAFRRDSA